jgi:hypothetical protein
MRQTHEEVLAKRRVNARRYYKENKDRFKRWNNKSRTPDRNRERYLKGTYGISSEEYNRLFEEQEGRCAICGEHQIESREHLFVDHNHEDGIIRGLLCHNCNVGLGNFHDDIELLEQAIIYLVQTKKMKRG